MKRLHITRPRIVLTYGRFDLFHQGHVQFLRQACQMGSDLVVGCATDDHASRLGTPCQRSFEQRRETLQACRYVSRVIPQMDQGQMRTDIVNHNASALVLSSEFLGLFDDMQDIAQVLYITPQFRVKKQANRPELGELPFAV